MRAMFIIDAASLYPFSLHLENEQFFLWNEFFLIYHKLEFKTCISLLLSSLAFQASSPNSKIKRSFSDSCMFSVPDH